MLNAQDNIHEGYRLGRQAVMGGQPRQDSYFEALFPRSLRSCEQLEGVLYHLDHLSIILQRFLDRPTIACTLVVDLVKNCLTRVTGVDGN
jgi:hypothetical protein